MSDTMIPMLSAVNKNLATILAFFLIQTCFVCTHKIQTEEECLSSNILCYDCDSRYDINCADPFDFSSLFQSSAQVGFNILEQTINKTMTTLDDEQQHVDQANPESVKTNLTISKRKKLPAFATCHGCCVKITSKTTNGSTYVKRTCTTTLQINYFMVGLVCMRESGDRGRMCFCESDFCNGQPSKFEHNSLLVSLVAIASVLRFFKTRNKLLYEL